MKTWQPSLAARSNGGRNQDRNFRRLMSASVASRPPTVSEYPAKCLAVARMPVGSARPLPW